MRQTNRGRIWAVITAMVLSGTSLCVASETWSGLRGPSYDGVAHDGALFEGDGSELTVTWLRVLGSGYSMVAVDGERLVTGFQEGDGDYFGAFDSATGDELWRYRIADAYPGHDGSHDGPISTPVLAGGLVHGLGPRGDLFTLDITSGEALWAKNLVEDLAAEAPFYGFTTSPLVAEEVLVVEVGAGEGKTFSGFDPRTGELLWSMGTDSVRYQSPIVAEIDGQAMVVVLGNKTIAGLEPRSGEIVWSYEHNGDERDMGGNTIVPIPSGPGRILLLNTHPTSVMLKIERDGDDWTVGELWTGGSLKSTYVQPVYHEGYLYGMNSKIFTCVDAATGEMKWRSRGPGDGFPTIVGDHLVIMEKPGRLHVAKVSPNGYEEVTTLDVFAEHSWSAPTYANGSLFLRSMGHLARVDPTTAGASEGDASPWVADTLFGGFLEELARADDKAAYIDGFLEQQSSFPIVEPSGAVHFVYRGDAADVGIVGDMIGYRREDPMTQVAGTDLFYFSTRLEPDAAVAYGFITDFSEPIPDPLNPRPGSGLFGDVSWLAMPARQSSTFLVEAEALRRGTFETVEWASAVKEGKTRQARVYLPVGYDADGEGRYPVAYILEGDDALEAGKMGNALDNLIGESVEPLIAVFILADPENPRSDLYPTDKFVEMIANEVVPLIDESFLTIAESSSRAIVGAADGGDTAIAAVFPTSELFGRLGSVWPIVFGVLPEIPRVEEHPVVIFNIWGSYHIRSPHEAWDQVEDNRSFWAALREAGYRPAGGEVPEGFGWECWRDHVDELFQALFPLR